MQFEEREYFEFYFSASSKVFLAFKFLILRLTDVLLINSNPVSNPCFPFFSLSSVLFVTCRASDHIYQVATLAGHIFFKVKYIPVVLKVWKLSFLITGGKVSQYGVISGPHFPAFVLNTERYFVYGPEITPYLDIFYAVNVITTSTSGCSALLYLSIYLS